MASAAHMKSTAGAGGAGAGAGNAGAASDGPAVHVHRRRSRRSDESFTALLAPEEQAGLPHTAKLLEQVRGCTVECCTKLPAVSKCLPRGVMRRALRFSLELPDWGCSPRKACRLTSTKTYRRYLVAWFWRATCFADASSVRPCRHARRWSRASGGTWLRACCTHALLHCCESQPRECRARGRSVSLWWPPCAMLTRSPVCAMHCSPTSGVAHDTTIAVRYIGAYAATALPLPHLVCLCLCLCVARRQAIQRPRTRPHSCSTRRFLALAVSAPATAAQHYTVRL